LKRIRVSTSKQLAASQVHPPLLRKRYKPTPGERTPRRRSRAPVERIDNHISLFPPAFRWSIRPIGPDEGVLLINRGYLYRVAWRENSLWLRWAGHQLPIPLTGWGGVGLVLATDESLLCLDLGANFSLVTDLTSYFCSSPW